MATSIDITVFFVDFERKFLFRRRPNLVITHVRPINVFLNIKAVGNKFRLSTSVPIRNLTSQLKKLQEKVRYDVIAVVIYNSCT